MSFRAAVSVGSRNAPLRDYNRPRRSASATCAQSEHRRPHRHADVGDWAQVKRQYAADSTREQQTALTDVNAAARDRRSQP
eukprot:11527568-Heterocapsa_arctica.AAC.1